MKKKLLSLLLAAVLILGLMPPVAAGGNDTLALQAADALYSLGLFRGTGANADGSPVYALERTPSRLEALTMLVRVLGKEKDALAVPCAHPFSDVEPWANAYVGYAYQNGLTQGVSDTAFGNSAVDAAQYLTFVLRALGYSDAAGDFSWSDPFPLAAQVGIVPQGTDLSDFRRADVALISYAALSAKVKGSERTLAQQLLGAQVFTQAQYDALFAPAATTVSAAALSSTQIAEKCAPAVFYIETYAINGTALGSGSGFLISSDGLAVTNYHVLADAYDALAMTTDESVYRLSILDGNQENDLALVRLEEAKDLPYLELAPNTLPKQGQKVYALGSPRGLDNTLSQGIISNPNRVIDDFSYLQISVPIAPGSSGGALLNEQGQVIGVTSAGYVNSTGDLNLAIPIDKVEVLDLSASEDLFLPSYTPYPVVDYIPDFGALTGARLLTELTYLQIGSGHVYDMNDFHDCLGTSYEDRFTYAFYMYETLLTELGFVLDSETDDSFFYTLGSESVRITLDFDNMEIWVYPMRRLQRYNEVDVVDFGWCIGVDSGSPTMVVGFYEWEYPWWGYYTTEETANMLGDYMDLLELDGFSFIENKDGSYIYQSEEYLLIITINDRTFCIGILPLSSKSSSSYNRR